MTLTEKTIECAHLCARLEIRGPGRENYGPRVRGGFASNDVKLVKNPRVFGRESPLQSGFTGLLVPIFRSRTAGIANGRLDIEDPEPAQLRELLPEVRRGK